MSNACINLIRDRVPSPGRRKLQFMLRISYLAFFGALVVIECHVLTGRVMQRMNLNREIELLNRGFAERHDDVRDHVEYAGRLCDELKSQGRDLGMIAKWMDQSVNLPAILAGLMTAVPASADLGELYSDRECATLFWSVVEPEETGPGLRPAELAAAWKKDETVSRYLTNVETVLTERRRLKGQSMIMHRFKGVLCRGEDA